MSQGREIEIKLRAPDPARSLALLSSHRFRPSRARVFEHNEVLDTEEMKLRSAGKLLRLRTAGSRQTLTFKGVAEAGPHKSREEREIHLDSTENIGIILDRIGFSRKFTYEKFRTEFERDGEQGIVTFDETPIGNFFEIEGEPEWIDRIAAELGFAEGDYVTASYGRLYEDWRRIHGEESRDMVFQAGALTNLGS
ncbi:class IV adenylate cyclase [Nevskia soli]|uniref:class IV adenylate cyclase n=1 Tax=Nevskia soli TaxID=418856 RepID=UPI0015D72820|nr:class IV adenylate cyclase [Nevskia soli]